MSDPDLVPYGMLLLTTVGMAIGVHRYIGGTADNLRKEWCADLDETKDRIAEAERKMDAMRDRLATKEDMARVEASLRDVNQTVSRQGAIEERVVGVQRQLDILIGYFKNGDPTPRKLSAGD